MLFDSTVRRELSRSFGVTFVVILTIVLTMMLIRTLGMAAGGSVAPGDVLLMLGYASLAHLPTMLCLSIFVAIVGTLGRMYRESEMTVWFASGVSLSRFIGPVLSVAVPVFIGVAVLVMWVWPWGNENSSKLRERYERRGDLSRVAPGQFKTSADGSRVFFIERDGDSTQTARNVFIMQTTETSESVTTALKGHIEFVDDQRYLVLEHGQRNETRLDTDQSKTLARFSNYRVVVDAQVMTSGEDRPPKAIPTLELLRNPSKGNQSELTWRLGMALGCFNMALLGMGMAASNPRRAGSWNLLFALLGFVVYFNLINLSQAWVASGKYSMPNVLLGVHGSALALALALLVWREQSHRLSWPKWSRRQAGAGASA